MNLARVLEQAASTHAERPALLLDGGVVTYEELERQAAAVTELLRGREVAAGDRVALTLPNGTAFVAAYFGALRLGAIVVPLNVLLRAREIAERLARSTPRVLVLDADREREAGSAAREHGVEPVRLDAPIEVPADPTAPPVERDDGDTAVLLFTSGTSGPPKGAMLTHGGVRAAARNAADALDLHEDDVMLGAAPFSHVLGQSTGIVSTFLAGGAIAVVPRFEAAETLRFMTDTGTTILLGVPAMCITLCEAARTSPALPPVRVAHVGGAPVPAEVARTFEQVFGGEVREGYGLTELSGIATTYRPGEERRPGSVGRPLGGTELRIVSLDGDPLPANEVGEVQLRGPSVVPGYWRDEEATHAALSPDGWLSTGDLGFVDADGYLYLVDRKKELIIRGGYNVYPREVEEVLYAHPDVLEAAVVGVPHDVLGEEVLAAVVPRPAAAPSAEAIQDFVRERVAAYKYPRHVVFVDTLPKGPTGKILKRELDPRRLLADAESRHAGAQG
jgi:long-chain acyl-CoA synthetase